MKILIFLGWLFSFTAGAHMEAEVSPKKSDTLSSSFGFYLQTDRDDHTGGNPKIDEDEFVFEGVILLDKKISERDRLGVKVIGDVISSASETRLWNPQFGALQSHASGNLRISLDVSMAHEFDSLNLGGHLGGSYEANLYGSVLYGLNSSIPLYGQNTILSLRLDGSTDIFEVKLFNGRNAGVSYRQSLSLSASLLQVLTPYDLVTFNADYISQFGTLETTFYSVFFRNIERSEEMPDMRNRGSIAGRWKHSLSPNNATELGYRFYGDDWSIFAHTIDAKFFQYLFAHQLLIEPSARFHQQTGAYFFKREFATLPDIRTSDTDLGPFMGVVLGLKLSAIGLNFFPTWLDTVSLSGKYWLRDDGFQIFWFDLGMTSRF